jgi:hypothetical protein
MVCAACGDRLELAPLVESHHFNMMSSIRGVGLKGAFTQGLAKTVPVISLDWAMLHFPQAANARLILKIDAEGFEPHVLTGARGLVNSGRVPLVIWECGFGFADGAERVALMQMLEDLSRRGFRHLRPPGQEIDGTYLPFTLDDNYVGNVFSFGPTFDTF